MEQQEIFISQWPALANRFLNKYIIAIYPSRASLAKKCSPKSKIPLPLTEVKAVVRGYHRYKAVWDAKAERTYKLEDAVDVVGQLLAISLLEYRNNAVLGAEATKWHLNWWVWH